MGSHRHHTWTDVAGLDQHLTVFLKLDEALEGFLMDFASSSHEQYKIRTDRGSVDRPSRARIGDAVDSLGGSLRSLEVWYTGPDGSRRVNLEIPTFFALPVSRVGCTLQVFGDDENETNGRFDTLFNRMDAEIKRRWPMPTSSKEMTALPVESVPSATLPAATLTSTSGFKQSADGVLRHPLWSAIIAGLVVVGVVAVIAALWKWHGG